MKEKTIIYNSRNYSILLNYPGFTGLSQSTTVEIILYYLTYRIVENMKKSTTVEIILYYLTLSTCACVPIYNSRNYSILLNFAK